MYYNTIRLKGEDLLEAKENAETQEKQIYNMMQTRMDFRAEDIERITKWPITSVRRSFNTLMKEGKVEVIGKAWGNYGRLVNVYRRKL